MVQQYTTQTLLAEVARRIDQISSENYSMHATQPHSVPVNGGNAVSVVADNGLYGFKELEAGESGLTYDTSVFELRPFLTQSDVHRLSEVNKIFSSFLMDGKLSVSQLRRVLTKQKLSEYETAVQTTERVEEALYGEGVPRQLHSYNLLLRKADFLWGRIESMPLQGSLKYKYGAAGRVEDKAVSLYEDALTSLEEIFSSAAPHEHEMLRAWLDRPIDFTSKTAIDTSPAGMPRVRGSQSMYALDAQLPKLSKRAKRIECGLKALVEVAFELAFQFPQVAVDEVDEELQRKQLKGKLKALKSSI